ncbi:hypothetical protein C8Q72DRAFT_819857 [Fomitopsis betulina]|nr:hypothetical protein C8Q72DRAFT_819857 [Fomitopsis betulina]
MRSPSTVGCLLLANARRRLFYICKAPGSRRWCCRYCISPLPTRVLSCYLVSNGPPSPWPSMSPTHGAHASPSARSLRRHPCHITYACPTVQISPLKYALAKYDHNLYLSSEDYYPYTNIPHEVDLPSGHDLDLLRCMTILLTWCLNVLGVSGVRWQITPANSQYRRGA